MATEQWAWSNKSTPSEELIIATTINNTLSLFPESSLYGTGNCRAVIMSQSGLMTGSDSKKRYPLTIDLAKKISRYCGRADGKWDGKWRFDEYPLNRLEGFYDVSDPWVDDRIKDMRWRANIVSVEYANTRELFYPAFQTSCDNDSSLFNSVFATIAGTQLEKIAYRVWTRLVGNSRLKGKAFTDKSDDLIIQLSEGLFDNRFRVTSRTYFTKNDEELGYAWSTEITIYGNLMKTYNTVTISGKWEDYV